MKQTLIRSVLKIGAGVLVAKGFTDDSTAEVIVAGLTALLSVLWGVFDRAGKVPPVVPCLALLLPALSLSGCATKDISRLVGQLKNDPAIVSAKITTLYGTAQMTRVGGQTNSVSVAPDGTITVNK